MIVQSCMFLRENPKDNVLPVSITCKVGAVRVVNVVNHQWCGAGSTNYIVCC